MSGSCHPNSPPPVPNLRFPVFGYNTRTREWVRFQGASDRQVADCIAWHIVNRHPDFAEAQVVEELGEGKARVVLTERKGRKDPYYGEGNKFDALGRQGLDSTV